MYIIKKCTRVINIKFNREEGRVVEKVKLKSQVGVEFQRSWASA